MTFTADTCPDRAKHTAHPSGYIAHEEWAEKKMPGLFTTHKGRE